MELIDIYDDKLNKTGKVVYRNHKLSENEYRLIVHLAIFHNGKLLIQKRSENVHSFKGKWDISSGGCVLTGESPEEGIMRETKEELGIEVLVSRPIITFYCEHEIDLIYSCTNTLVSFVATRDVSEIKYASLSEVLQMIDNGAFVKYKKGIIQAIFDFYQDRNEYFDNAWENE